MLGFGSRNLKEIQIMTTIELKKKDFFEKVQKKREIKVQVEEGNKSPNRIWKVNEREKNPKTTI